MTELSTPKLDRDSSGFIATPDSSEASHDPLRFAYESDSTSERTRKWSWRVVSGVLIVVVAGVVGGWAVLRNRNTTPTIEELQSVGWSSCFVLNFNEDEGDKAVVDRMWEGVRDGEWDDGGALDSSCGVNVRERDDSWTITWQPEEAYSDAGFYAVKAIGEKARCLTDTDSERIVHTRALDGLVDGERQGTSWTYSPDDGLAIICKK